MIDESERLIKSEYLEGIDRAAFDNDLTRALQSQPSGYPGSAMTVAVENERGIIYRVITTSGISAYQFTSAALARLGLEDRLANDFSGKSPYSCVFAKPR
jgi:hypothetical protein